MKLTREKAAVSRAFVGLLSAVAIAKVRDLLLHRGTWCGRLPMREERKTTLTVPVCLVPRPSISTCKWQETFIHLP